MNWHGVNRNWLHFGDDYNYIAFNDKGTGINRNLKGASVGLAHFAYVINDIKALENRLNQTGFQAAKAGPENQYRKNLYYIDPDDYEVEFVQYHSDLPQQRNN